MRATAVFLLACVLQALSLPSAADTARVAIASNFAATAGELAAAFAESSGHEVLLAPGSTGKHYAQIRHGAPFDAFLAADRERPERLEREGLGIAGTRFTYALGRLVLWSPDPQRVDGAGTVLTGASFRHLAIANPDLAPYGRAARQVLIRLDAWPALEDRIVRGENVGQAFHFVHSGTAELGFVAAAQVLRAGGSTWVVPRDLYPPIEQQAVLLRPSPVARDFLAFLRSDEGRALIRAAGYDTP